MQIVYISNRPTVFADTIKHVALFMPFIDKILVCVPDRALNQFQEIQTAIDIRIIAESRLLNNNELATLSQRDHQRRNYLLRTRLISTPDIDAQFIMSDDDARPLKEIDIKRFIEGDRYRRYYFYDLASWDNNQTEFDDGQISTYAVLEHEDLPHLSYASHMPQIIDRALFIEATDFFKPYAQHHALCEWSTYFNYAGAKHPEKFCSPEAYATLCWPEHPLAWKLFVAPNGYLFENYTPALYKGGQAFSDLTIRNSDRKDLRLQNIQKVVNWLKYTTMKRHPEQSSSLFKYANPRTWFNKFTK